MEENKVENEKKEEFTVGKKKRPFDLTVKIYKIVSLIIYLVWTAFLGFNTIKESIDVYNGVEGAAVGWIFFFIFFVVLMGLIGYGIITFIGITGLSLSIANKNNPKRKGNIIFFAVGIVLAVGTFFALIYLGTGIVNARG